MFDETKKYLSKQRPAVEQAISIGKGLVKEFLVSPQSSRGTQNGTDISISRQAQLRATHAKSLEERKRHFAEQEPRSLAEDYFYKPYIARRTRIVQLLQEEGVNVKSHPVHAAFVSLIAASEAGYTAAEIPAATGYFFEFRLPEQYLVADDREKIDQFTERVKLFPDTKGLAAEIVQAWMLVDFYAGESNPVADRFSIPHNSLRKTTCSFLGTCEGTDLSFGDIGITSHFPSSDMIGDISNFLELRPGIKMESTDPLMMQQISKSFMERVQSWEGLSPVA